MGSPPRRAESSPFPAPSDSGFDAMGSSRFCAPQFWFWHRAGSVIFFYYEIKNVTGFRPGGCSPREAAEPIMSTDTRTLAILRRVTPVGESGVSTLEALAVTIVVSNEVLGSEGVRCA